MNISLELTKETADKVTRAAADAGKDVPSFLEDFVKRSFTGEDSKRTVAEILAPFRAEIEQSGVTDEQLNEVFTEARDHAFSNRPMRRR
jgi:hypothetical protein